MLLIQLGFRLFSELMTSSAIVLYTFIWSVVAILISFTISYEIVFITLEMFYCDRHMSIHIIYLA